MPLVVIQVKVRQPGEEADRLLAAVAKRLDRDKLEPDDGGVVIIRFFGAEDTPADAWKQVHDALEAADPSWEKLVALGPPPTPQQE
jgi:hypothetical protein